MPNDTNRSAMSEATYYILLSLSAGPKHGYAVLKEIQELSNGRISLSVSTLYTALSRLQEQGMIERQKPSQEPVAPGLPRKVYRITRRGLSALEAEANRIKNLLAAYHQKLGTASQ